MFEFASWKLEMTVWSKVCWNVDPDPFSVTLAPEEPPGDEFDDGDLLLLPHAASTTARPVITTGRRERLRVVFKWFLRSDGLGSTRVIVGTGGGSEPTSE